MLRRKPGPHCGYELASTPKATRRVTVRDIEWSAGFLEGEGSFLAGKDGCQRVQADQKHRETLDRLSSCFGGRVTARRGRNIWLWKVYGSRARGVMLTLYSLMSSRRQQQIRRALRGEKEAKAA